MRNLLDFTGKVALVTGAARGQGRSHVIRLAEQGADVLALDLCAQIGSVPYAMSSPEDLEETVRLASKNGRRILAEQIDVRDLSAMQSFVGRGVGELGRLDVVVANAGTVNGLAPLWELSEQEFRDQIEVNLFGAWTTIKAVVPKMISQGQGGSIILTSSVAGMVAELNAGHYTASKHGVVGLMRTLAAELAPHSIRVNTINPACVDTPMIDNAAYNEIFAGGKKGATQEDALPALRSLHALPVPFVESEDITNAVLYLGSELGRYVTGTTMVVDAGALIPFKIPH